MEIEYDVTRDDYWAFQRFVMFRRSWLFKLLLAITAALVLYTAAGPAVREIRDNGDVGMAALIAVVLALPPVLVALGLYAVVRWWVKRLPSARGTMLGRRHLRISGDGLREEGDGGTVAIATNRILDVAETRDHVFVFTDRIAGFVVPRRAFASVTDARRFCSLARSFTPVG